MASMMMLFRLLNDVVVCVNIYGVHANYTYCIISVRDFNEKRENVAYAGACSFSMLLVVLTCKSKSGSCTRYVYCFASIYTRDNIERLGRKVFLCRRKIRLIEGNTKSHHLRKLTCKGTLR
jgi:hypothetical protein